MRIWARLAVATIVLATGCTPAAPSTRPGPSATPPSTTPPTVAASTIPAPTGTGTVNCDHSIAHLKTPSPGTRTVLGVVALPGRVLSPVRDQDGWLWAKQGLEVRAGAVVEIVVAPAAAGHAKMGWGSPAEPGGRLTVTGCPTTGCVGGCDWLAFAGGYWVDAPRCVPLVIRSGGREERIGVAVGTPC
jgi:hypothetical protein